MKQLVACLPLGFAFSVGLSAQQGTTRNLTLSVDEVTQACLAVSPHGDTLYFSILGDLVALPSVGGRARQLTSGPEYDSWPNPSADGEWLYFLSDRGTGSAELHRLHLEDRRIEKLTDLGLGLDQLCLDHRSGRFAAVAAGGRAIFRGLPDGTEPLLDRVPPGLSRPGFLADGRAVALERSSRSGSIQATDGGAPEVLYRPTGARWLVWGSVDPTASLAVVVESGPWTYRQPDFEELLVVHLGDGEVLLRRNIGPAHGEPGRMFRPAFTRDRIYLPLDGGISVLDLKDESLSRLEWEAELEFRVPSRNDRPLRDPGIPAGPFPLRTMGDVRPSPDGERVVFAAAGDLYVQERGGRAQRLTDGPAFDSLPIFESDGERILFARDGRLHRLSPDSEVEDLGVPVSGELADYFMVDRNGQRLTTFGSYRAPAVIEVDLASGNRTTRLPGQGSWVTYPSYGVGGEILFVRAVPGGTPQILSLAPDATEPRVLSDLRRPPHRAVGSADGRFLAFLRDGRAWYGRRSSGALTEDDVTPVGPVGAHGLVFGAEHTLWISAGSSVVSFDCEARQTGDPWDLQLTGSPAPPPAPLLIRNVHYVDVEGGQVVRNASIKIRNRHIAGIYGTDDAPTIPDATVLDGSGRYVIPGLFDAHVHNLQEEMSAILAYGVTTVRQLGSAWPVQRRDSELVRLGRRPGPDFISSAEIFEGPAPEWGNAFHIVEEPAEALSLFDQRLELGMDVLKVYPTLSRAVRRPLIARAIERGVPTTAHVTDLENLVSCISDGIGCIEHFPEGAPQLRSDVLALLAAADVAWCPTLAVRGAGDYKKRLQPDELLDPLFRRAVPEAHLGAWQAREKINSMGDESLEAFMEERGRILARAAQLGVILLTGSDCSTGNALIGPSTHWEMEFLVRGGLSPLDALRTATLSPARLWGLDRGVIRTGAWADLVLLRRNPLEDIRNTRAIDIVVRAGSVFTPEELLSSR